MKLKPLPPAKHLRECFSYSKRTGILLWRKRPLRHFVTKKEFLRWNVRFADREALSHVMKAGHKRITVDSEIFLAHRVIWKMVVGKDPANIIDHRDLDGSNNRWKNLREADDSESVCNRDTFKNNTSGCPGVIFSKQHRKWRVTVQFRKKRTELGLYADLAKAVSVRQAHIKEHHGEFAR